MMTKAGPYQWKHWLKSPRSKSLPSIPNRRVWLCDRVPSPRNRIGSEPSAAAATADRRRDFKRPGSAQSRTTDTKRARYDAPPHRSSANRYDRDAARPNERRRATTRNPNTRDPDPRDSRPHDKRRATESDSERDHPTRYGTDTERYKPVRVHEERHDRGTRNLERRDHSRDHSNHSRSNSRSSIGSDEIYIPSPIKDLHGQDSN
jgi:hypothetical protein